MVNISKQDNGDEKKLVLMSRCQMLDVLRAPNFYM